MKNRNEAIVTIEEIKEILDKRNLVSQVKEGFDVQEEVHFTQNESTLKTGHENVCGCPQEEKGREVKADGRISVEIL